MNSPNYKKQCVEIDDLQLNDEFKRIPADYAYWSGLYSEAKQVYLLAKIERSHVWARTRLELRETLTMQGERVTEARLDAEAEVNDEYHHARQEEALAEVEMVRLNGVLEAIKTKREMLISLGAHVRQEMKTF